MQKPKFCSTCGSTLLPQMRDGFERLVCSDDNCDFVFWNNPTPVVGAIVQQGDDIILVQNIGWPSHWFALVTGFLEANESPEEGIKREVKEEIGVTVESLDLVGLYPFFKRNQLLIIYHVQIDDKAVVELQADEIAAYKKVPIEKVQPWDSGTGLALRDWLHSQGYERSPLPLDEIH